MKMMVMALVLGLAGVALGADGVMGLAPAEYRALVSAQLDRAGKNRSELERALADVKPENRAAMAFLIAYMPEVDARSISSALLLENAEYAGKARREFPWAASIPEDVYLDAVLPYASVNERRDNWRKDFYTKARPWVKECKTAGDAALAINERLFNEVKVHYHATKRPKADQSPYESMEAGYASCSGLAILLIDACRAVGVPARFVGTPEWTTGKGDANGNHAGNHSWVEVWDGQWHVLGASEVSPLDLTWFLGNASKADPTREMNRIYASTWRKTGTHFPLVWDETIGWVNAEDVTQSYLKRIETRVVVKGASRAMRAHVRVMLKGRVVGDFEEDGRGVELWLSQGQGYEARIGQASQAFVAPGKGGVVELEHGR